MLTSKLRHGFLLLSLMILPMAVPAETASSETVTVYHFNQDKPEVPDDALTVRAGIPGVFVANQEQARFRMVRAGKSRKQFTAILSGLKNNDAVIREPHALFDGQNIKVAQ